MLDHTGGLLDRVKAWITRHVHATQGVVEDVGPLVLGVGSILAEGGHAGQHHVGFALSQLFETESESVHVARSKTLDHDV